MSRRAASSSRLGTSVSRSGRSGRSRSEMASSCSSDMSLGESGGHLADFLEATPEIRQRVRTCLAISLEARPASLYPTLMRWVNIRDLWKEEYGTKSIRRRFAKCRRESRMLLDDVSLPEHMDTESECYVYIVRTLGFMRDMGIPYALEITTYRARHAGRALEITLPLLGTKISFGPTAVDGIVVRELTVRLNLHLYQDAKRRRRAKRVMRERRARRTSGPSANDLMIPSEMVRSPRNTPLVPQRIHSHSVTRTHRDSATGRMQRHTTTFVPTSSHSQSSSSSSVSMSLSSSNEEDKDSESSTQHGLMTQSKDNRTVRYNVTDAAQFAPLAKKRHSRSASRSGSMVVYTQSHQQ